jgi:phosphoglycolate phosphatase-like HAD superfamily hydrolase
MRHIVWDWNGTLFDDLHIVVDSVNASLAEFGEGPIDEVEYRSHYRRPVPLFYESLLGRPIGEDIWRAIDETFHITYRESLDRAGLAPDALAALDAVDAAGATQSILSMWWHDHLVPAVEAFGLEARMLLVDGHRGAPGAAKAEHLRDHIRELRGLLPGLADTEVVVIGDITDDAEAAAAVGIGCVLYDSGSQPRAMLEAAGVPVADTLLRAVGLAGVPVRTGASDHGQRAARPDRRRGCCG